MEEKIHTKAVVDMPRVDYGFDQWSVLSFVIKELFVYLFMAKQCIY